MDSFQYWILKNLPNLRKCFSLYLVSSELFYSILILYERNAYFTQALLANHKVFLETTISSSKVTYICLLGDI